MFFRTPDVDTGGINQIGKEVKGRNQTYYQALIDSRDFPHIVSLLCSIGVWPLFAQVLQWQSFNSFILKRAQTEAVTFLGQQENSKSLYAIPGLDYVAHEDILPYRTTEPQPINHELFEKFLMPDPDKGCCFPVQ